MKYNQQQSVLIMDDYFNEIMAIPDSVEKIKFGRYYNQITVLPRNL